MFNLSPEAAAALKRAIIIDSFTEPVCYAVPGFVMTTVGYIAGRRFAQPLVGSDPNQPHSLNWKAKLSYTFAGAGAVIATIGLVKAAITGIALARLMKQ